MFSSLLSSNTVFSIPIFQSSLCLSTADDGVHNVTFVGNDLMGSRAGSRRPLHATSFRQDLAAAKVAAEAGAAARSAFAAFSRSRDKLKMAHDSLMAASAAATMAQVAASSSQEAAAAQVALAAGMNQYPIALPTSMDQMDELLLGTFWEALRVSCELVEGYFQRLDEKSPELEKSLVGKGGALWRSGGEGGDGEEVCVGENVYEREQRVSSVTGFL